MSRFRRFTPSRSTFRDLSVDLTPLRESRDFRLSWLSLIISETGTSISLVAIFYQVYQLTRSSAAVGLVGLAKFIPLMIASIGGGGIIDAVDRRKLIIITQTGLALSSVALLITSLADRPNVLWIYGIAGVASLFHGLDSPAKSAMTPRLVPPEKLAGALALKQVAWTATMVVGPSIGGLIIARYGLSWAYGIDVVSFAAALVVAYLLRPMPPEAHPDGAPRGFAAIAEGFRFLRGRKVIQGTFAIDLFAMIFGMPRALFPVLAAVQFDKGAEVVGALFAAPAAGALIGAFTSGWVGKVRRQGLAVMASVAVWGFGIAAFGLVGDRLWLALVLLAVAGGADVISAVFRSTILQQSVPDALRGRMSGIFILVVAGGPRLGDLEAGLVAEAFSPMVSVVSGGVLCLVGVALMVPFFKEFVRYRTDEPSDSLRPGL